MQDRLKYRLIAVLWPTFALAAVATGLFFSTFDPHDLLPFGASTSISRLAVYSIGFLVFWLYSAISVAVGLYFVAANQRADAGGARRNAK